MERRILFVEDDANFRELFTPLMREALAPEQLDVAFVEVGSASEARARLREGGLDAALIDVTLPDGNGIDLVEQINDGSVGEHIPPRVLMASLETSVAGRAWRRVRRVFSPRGTSVSETAEAIVRLTEVGKEAPWS
jgi:CheY-like chemotaxis protein